MTIETTILPVWYDGCSGSTHNAYNQHRAPKPYKLYIPK